MPNFSHGTAGVSYFLADLHGATKERAFLDAARAGAAYLKHIAACTDGGCVVRHHDGDGEHLFYLSWCHGPAGTARLYHRLGQLTGEPQWRTRVSGAAKGSLASGSPEQRTPGFWNNVSQCCGNAGVADFFLDLARTNGDRAAATFARRMTDDMLARGTRDEQGLRWVQAEHRAQPNLLVAQTGWMQGAAGMGSLLLKLDAAEQRRPFKLVLPDSPFRA